MCARQLVYHANINATIDRIKSRRRWNLLVVARETCSWWCWCGRYRRKAEPVFDFQGCLVSVSRLRSPLAETGLVAGTQNQDSGDGSLTCEPTWFASWFASCNKCRMRSQELTSSQYLLGAGAGAGAGAGECTAVGAAVRGDEGSCGYVPTECF